MSDDFPFGRPLLLLPHFANCLYLGDVAQMVERTVSNGEAVGSIPSFSNSFALACFCLFLFDLNRVSAHFPSLFFGFAAAETIESDQSEAAEVMMMLSHADGVESSGRTSLVSPAITI